MWVFRISCHIGDKGTEKTFFQSNVKVFTNPIRKQNETKKLVDMNTDICKFAKRKSRTNPLNIYMLGLVNKYGKIPRCPVMKVVSFLDSR